MLSSYRIKNWTSEKNLINKKNHICRKIMKDTFSLTCCSELAYYHIFCNIQRGDVFIYKTYFALGTDEKLKSPIRKLM